MLLSDCANLVLKEIILDGKHSLLLQIKDPVLPTLYLFFTKKKKCVYVKKQKTKKTQKNPQKHNAPSVGVNNNN